MSITAPNIILPAEWDHQLFIQLTWPHIDTDWAEMLDEVNDCFVQIAKAVLQYEKLLVVCPDATIVKTLLKGIDISKITFVELPTNDTWSRDHGGITVFEDDKTVIYDFTFNGWGMKFAANHDNRITKQLFEQAVFNKETDYRNLLDSAICYVQCTDEKDEHYTELRKMEEELKAFKTLNGQPYELIPLPMSDVVFDGEDRLPATYANFLIINGAVLLPSYDSPKDEIAKQQLKKAFPDREIILIDCRPLIKQHGSLHCVTMQYPNNSK